MPEKLTEAQARRCDACRWWVAKASLPRNDGAIPDGFGECRRRAPVGGGISVYLQRQGKPVSAVSVAYPFPVSADADWCGEFVQRAAEEE